jgi:hypothetical protein
MRSHQGIRQTPAINSKHIDELNELAIQYFQQKKVREALVSIQRALDTFQRSLFRDLYQLLLRQ